MKTRVSLSMVAMLVILLFAASAQATSPSITTDDLSRVVGFQVGSWDDNEWTTIDEGPDTIAVAAPTPAPRQSGGGLTPITDEPIPLAGPFSIQVVANTPEVQNELNKIAAFMQEKSLPVVDFFDFSAGNTNGELKNQIASLLPAGFDLNTLVMNEFVTIEPFFYSEETGDVLTTFDFPTEYKENQIMVAVVGIFDDNGNVEWVPLKAETVKDANGVNRVQVCFTQDVLTKANDKPFALAILSE